MDTQDTGTIDQTDATAAGDTAHANDDGTQLKRINDKKEYLKQLEQEIKDLDRNIKVQENSRNTLKGTIEDQDDVITWASAHFDDLHLASQEYQEELKFYKDHKITITNDIRDRALRDAKDRKGLLKEKDPEQERQAATSSPTGGEMRRGKAPESLPDSVKKLAPSITPEKYAQYKAEFAAQGKKV